MTASRIILHADMDAFYASVEQRDDPSLRGKPVIVGGLGRRGVVSTASYEARVHGVHSALPMAIARQRCPQAAFLTPRMERYAADSARLRELFGELTDLIEPLSLDEAFLDVSASARLFGDGEAMARRLQERVAEELRLSVSVGVASNKFVAKVASDLDKPRGLTLVPAGEERAFLGPLPLKVLWGVGPATRERLGRIGVGTVGEVLSTARVRLVEALGERLADHLCGLARGEDQRAVQVERDAKSIGRETTFETDLVDAEACHEVLLRLAEDVAARLRRAQLKAGVVRLKLRHPPFVTLSRQRSLATPTDDELTLFRHAAELLDTARGASQRPVRLLGVTGAELSAADAGEQAQLFAQAPAERNAIHAALDAVRDRFGPGAVRRAGPQDPRK